MCVCVSVRQYATVFEIPQKYFINSAWFKSQCFTSIFSSNANGSPLMEPGLLTPSTKSNSKLYSLCYKASPPRLHSSLYVMWLYVAISYTTVEPLL